MNLSNFLQELIIKGWKFWNEEDRLRYRAPKEESTSSILAQLKEHKAEILQLLRENPSIFNVCPLSYGQKALWFLWQLEPESHAYNVSFAGRIDSEVDITAMQRAFETLIERHPILRTNYLKLGSETIQKIHNFQKLDFKQIDAQSWSEEQFKAKVIETHQQPFDLEREPVLRVRWFTRFKQEHVLLLTIHHIACDLWSLDILIQELSKLYSAQLVGIDASVAPVKHSYQDYVNWQRKILCGTKGEKLWSYWQEKLHGDLSALNLPTDKQRPLIQTYNGASIKFKLSSKLTSQLKELARREGVTFYMMLLAAFEVLLYRYTGQEDILVGSPTSGRSQPEFVPIVGYFVDPVVLRADLSDNPSFKDFLRQVRQTVLEAITHQDYPFALLVEKLQPHRDPSRSPIFQASFALQQFQESQKIQQSFVDEMEKDINWGGLKLKHEEIPLFEGQFDLNLEMTEGNYEVAGILKYNVDLFNNETIERMVAHFQNLLEAIVENPQESVGSFNLLCEWERHQLLVEWNDTATEYPQDKCIHKLFEEQVEKTPNAIAVVFEEEELTYEQLNERANQLAHYLQSLGVKPEVLVGICVERSVEMVVGLLGILKAGGAYVPIDPNYPQERLSYMLDDSGVGVLVTQNSLLESLSNHDAEVVCLDSDCGVISQQSRENIDVGITSDNLAYVIYTSGSTGKPKGVAIEHQSSVALCHWAKQTFSTSQLSGVLATTSICFDLSVFELFVTLCLGGKVIVADNALDIANHNHNKEITLINTVPSVITELLRVEGIIPEQVMTVNLAGEPIQNQIVEKLYEHQNVQYVYNLYGPSEDTTYSTFALLAKGTTEQPSIGRPIANTQIYILDSHLQPVPVGVPGELYIGGDGLARGYLNRPQLTSEKFIPNPFNSTSKLYKTGDLARYLSDGNIEFLGRIDNQVKIRGFRIELGEIEAVLATHPQINQTIVIAREENSGNKRLVAYVVTDSEITTTQLREYLKAQLPDYMVPSAFVTLDSLPLTPNGKIDHQALPAPEIERETEYVAPRTEVEQILTNIWQELLPVNLVSIHDNFFEIGGDSILSIQVISRARNSGIQISAKQIFHRQTIAELATVAKTIITPNSKQGIITGIAPLTPIQHWFFEQQTEEIHHYNQSVLLEIPHNIKPELLEKAVEKLIEHHDALRLSFTQIASEYKQTNQGLDNQVPLTVIDLSQTPIEEQPQEIEKLASQYQGSLNLSTGQIIQVVMFNLGEKIDGRLLIIIHHLAVDGISWRILLAELETLSQQLINEQPPKLAPKTTAFIDWATKLNNYAQSELIKQELNYWLNQPWSKTTPIPLDYPENQPQNKVASAVNISVKLNSQETNILLGAINEAYNTQINDILLSALSTVLAEWTGNTQVLIDLEGHGREEIFEEFDLSLTVGWFTSLFPVLLQIPENNNIASVIKSIKEQLRAIPNRRIGFGILRYLSTPEIREQVKTIPTPEIVFNYLGQFDQIQSETGWKFATESTGNNHSLKQNRSHILEINALVIEGELQINWTYSSNIHSHNTVENLAQNYLQAIRSIIKHCQVSDHGGYTPSDFPLAQLNQLEIDELLAKQENKNIDSIYPLSPSQEGMLLETLFSSNQGIHIEQFILNLQGKLDFLAFEKAWQRIVDRYSLLRTAFIWSHRNEPLQVVFKGVEVKLEQQDWRGFSPCQQQEKLQTYLQEDRLCGFQMTTAPLIRLALMQTGENTYQFIFTSHHILMDGWSFPLILKEVFVFYEAFSTGKDLSLPPSRPYSDYIAWLKQQDLLPAETFWHNQLQGFTTPTPLGNIAQPVNSSQLEMGYGKEKVTLSASTTAALQSKVRQHGLTLNSLVQGIWALLLSRYNDREDVLFGATVSGRPPDLLGVESMVGLFINTIPIRLQVSPGVSFWSWLEDIQSQSILRRDYEYCSQGQIHQWSDIPSSLPLYESILVFENYPVDLSVLESQNHNINLLEVDSIGAQTKYALTIIVVPGSQLELSIIYDKYRFEHPDIIKILAHFQILLNSIVNQDSSNLAALIGQIPPEQIPQVRLAQRQIQKQLPQGFDTPRNLREFQLVQIWKDILAVDNIGIHDNFFELGGHSLLATQLISRIREALDIEIPLRELFSAPTVASLDQTITQLRNSNDETPSQISLPTIIPTPEEKTQPFPLTDIQQAYWLGRNQNFDLGNIATHGYIEIDCSNLHLPQLNQAWQKLIEHHDMLRAIVLADGEQKILEEIPSYPIEILDLSSGSESEITQELETIRTQMSHEILPAEQWPLFKIRATILDEKRTRLHLSFDAIIADAWSMMLLGQQWQQLYENPQTILPPLEISFRDYVVTELSLKNTPKYKQAQEYWFNRHLPPAPQLPFAIHPSSISQPTFKRHSARLEAIQWQQLKQRATKANLTPSALLLAVFADILNYWSKTPNFTINLTLFNRWPLHPQVNQLVGDFTSLTLLEVDNSSITSFTARAQRLQQQLWQDLDHNYVSGVEVQRELRRVNSNTQSMGVVFTSTLGLNSLIEDSSSLNQLGDVVYAISQTPQVWLDHQILEEDGALVFNWDVVEELFLAGLMEDMFASYCNWLEQLANTEDAWLETHPQLLPAQQHSTIVAVNDTNTDVVEETLHSLFHKQVAGRSQFPAVISPQKTLTYEELYQKASNLAQQLRQLGATPNSLVAVIMEKGWEQIVAVLGILMSGAAYLPISAEFPPERQQYLLEEGKVKLVITQPQLEPNLSIPSGIECLVVTQEELQPAVSNQLESIQTPEDLAYVIYTSGSTGKPKGVMIDHKGAVNTILDINKRFGVGVNDRLLAVSALEFDLSVYDIFGILAAGGAIVIPESEPYQRKNPAHWLELINGHQVTIWNTVPALMQMLVEHLSVRRNEQVGDLRLALLSGDWLPVNLPEQIKSLYSQIEVISLGGATEASIWSIFHPIDKVESHCGSIPYGKPLDNQRFYVLNKLMQPTPTWVEGELYIGGIGLAKGYWQDEAKTNNSFITHPLTEERLYKTGDLGRYLPSGEIEFLGREDFQVKINGFRIELGEIEVALKEHPAVKEAVVNSYDNQLVAYVVPQFQGENNLINSSEASTPEQLSGVVINPIERLEFKLKQPGLRQFSEAESTIDLPLSEIDKIKSKAYFQRQSYRQFLHEPITLEDFSEFLSCLLQKKLDDFPLPKYRYPSAGNLYPVQTYLLIKPNGVKGLLPGIYYYHPGEHNLRLINTIKGINSDIYGGNKSIFEQSAFSIFLMGKISAIAPMYGELARDFCLLEAGHIGQLLMENAHKKEIGLCPIGKVEFGQIREKLELESNQPLLYSFVGGKIDLAQTLQISSSEVGGGKKSILTQMHEYLKQKLPNYMVPSECLILESLPLTANGKIDRQALPAPDMTERETEYVAPRTVVEKQLAQIWTEIIGVRKISIYDDFFQLGGDSLGATRVISTIRETFQVEFPLQNFFEAPTVKNVADYLEVAHRLLQIPENIDEVDRERGEI